ncbi:MAG: hypothetical protein ACE5HJ_03345 [Thermoplasmata archaeon]
MVEAYLTGIFPRSEKLIAATRALDRGRASQEEVKNVLRRDAEEVVQLQLDAGMAFASDGLLNWQDIFRPLVEAWDGLSLGGLRRWFDNNTFFRQPVVSSSLEPRPIPDEYLQVGLLPGDRPWKAVLPGPYTFTDMAENRYYQGPREALLSLAECLADVSKGLESKGFHQVQFNEPSLVVNPPQEALLEDVKEAYEIIRRSVDMQISLHTFFGSARPLLPHLLDFPVDILGLDLYEEGLDGLGQYDFVKVLACGCVDSRNSLLERPEEISKIATQALEALNPKDIILCPNADLEFLPRGVAEDKVRALGLAAETDWEVV